jgi:hypothetical protein
MSNTRGKEDVNKREFVSYMQNMQKVNKLIKEVANERDIYHLKDGKNDIKVDVETGEYINRECGKHKSNRRAYAEIKLPNGETFMCPNYTFRLVADGFLSGDWHLNHRCMNYWDEKNVDINHINGDTLDNRSENLEVVSKGMNRVHSRLMSEIHVYYPYLVGEIEDCQGNRMHVWKDGVGLKCEQIEAWNKRNPDLVIKAFKDKAGTFRSRFTHDQVTRMLKYFGKL